jgi:hypothetical protein
VRVPAVLGILAVCAAAALAAPSEDEVQRARELYTSAEAELAAGEYADAVRDYGGAYDLTKDSALLFKIGVAYEKAGACGEAVVWWRKYLATSPPASFVKRAEERLAACAAPAPEPAPPAAGPAVGSGSDGASSGAGGSGAGSSASGSADGVAMSARGRAAWVLASAAAGFATIGGVLAYAASSSENDIRDLYIGNGGRPPVFDATTKKRYDELVDEGRRYQHLSWAAFGLAGASAVGAAVLFYWRHDARVEPTVSPHGAGVSVRF